MYFILFVTKSVIFFLYCIYRIVILIETLRVLYEVRTESVHVGVTDRVLKSCFVGYNAKCARRNLWPGDCM